MARHPVRRPNVLHLLVGEFSLNLNFDISVAPETDGISSEVLLEILRE
jgi:hypothetical protein